MADEIRTAGGLTGICGDPPGRGSRRSAGGAGAGKPENDRLRVVAEGECVSEATVRQLVDMLNGVVLLAQAGLNDAKTREQLDPVAREAYLELLKSADVSKMDRGDTKSVRLMFEITPKFLQAARSAPSAEPGSVPAKPLPGKATTPKKGHT